MKYFIVIVMILMSLSIFSQDIVIKRNGDTLKVHISKSTPDQIEFNFLHDTVIHSENKDTLVKIIYVSGQEENCYRAKKLPVVHGAKDYKKVEITTNPDDVKGLTKLGEVVGKSVYGGESSPGYVDLGAKRARNNLKEHAARLGGSIVLLKEKGETLNAEGVKIVGTAYK